MGSEVITKQGFKLYYHPTANKKYKETVVFVHHMWGNHRTPSRHYKYLNEKGFDCVSFDLVMGSDKKKFHYHPLLKYFHKGVFYIWTRQIRSILNEIDGDKIIYAFSGPSLSAFWAADKRTDIKKVICDGGPFHNVYENTKNFFYYEIGIKNETLNSLLAYLGALIWGYKPLRKLHKVLRAWRPHVPILSIRGCRDNIVDIDTIRGVFAPHAHLNLKTMEIPQGKHLDGLRDFPEQYRKQLFPFITKNFNDLSQE